MKIPDFYENRWNSSIKCRKDYESDTETVDYIRTEYELWSLWIDRFYNGEHGIFNTLDGDAPRYLLEDDMDFCLFEKEYKKNYFKKDHLANHKARSRYIINRLTSIFKKVEKYDTSISDEDEERYNINFEEMKHKMSRDSTYEKKWFKAADDANNYIVKLLNKKSPSNKRSKKRRKSTKKKSRK